MNLVCPLVTIILLNGTQFLEEDKKRIAKHAQGCKRNYVNSPCLYKWTKVSDSHVNAICGAKVAQYDTIKPVETQEK